MTDYEYGTALLNPAGELFDFYPETGGVEFNKAIQDASEWNEEEADSEDSCVVVRRVAPRPPGVWEIVVNPSGRKSPDSETE